MKSNILMMHILDVHTDAPFKDLFVIKPAVLSAMTEDMKKHGFDIVHPIVVWGGHNGVVVDGHTRLQAAKDAGVLNVPIVIKDFASEEDALQYAISSQRNRRNLTDAELLNCISALDSRFSRGGNPKASREAFGKSAKKTADLLGISRAKVERLRAVNDHASDNLKNAVASGDISIYKAYNEAMAERRATPRTLESVMSKTPAEIKAERTKVIVKSISEMVKNRLEREYQEYPEVTYSEQEKEEIKKQLTANIAELVSTLLAGENKNAE